MAVDNKNHQLLKLKVDIISWLKFYKIDNIQLIENEEYGYIVDVLGSVNLFEKDLKKIEVKFNTINGAFDCSMNELKALNGCPHRVNGNFFCYSNLLTNLVDGPEYVKNDYLCFANQITCLLGVPEIINGDFDCSFNKIKKLQYCPKNIKKIFLFNDNLIESLSNMDFPTVVGGKVFLHNNLLSEQLLCLNDFQKIKVLLEKEHFSNTIGVKKNKNNNLLKI